MIKKLNLSWFACVLTLFLFSGLAQAKSSSEKILLKKAKIGKWTMDYEAAVKLAEKKKLPLFLNFTGSDWCGWCKHMEKKVFAKKKWKKYAKENLILVWVDFPRDKSLVPLKYKAQNQRLQKSHGIKGYPTYLILDWKSKEVIGEQSASREANPLEFIEETKAITSQASPKNKSS